MKIFGFKIVSVKEYEKLEHTRDVRTIRKLTKIMVTLAEREMKDVMDNMVADLIDAVKDESGRTVRYVLDHYEGLANRV